MPKEGHSSLDQPSLAHIKLTNSKESKEPNPIAAWVSENNNNKNINIRLSSVVRKVNEPWIWTGFGRRRRRWWKRRKKEGREIR